MDNIWPAVGAIIAVLGIFQGLATLYVRYLILQHVQTCPWPVKETEQINALERKITSRIIDLEQKVDRHVEAVMSHGRSHD